MPSIDWKVPLGVPEWRWPETQQEESCSGSVDIVDDAVKCYCFRCYHNSIEGQPSKVGEPLHLHRLICLQCCRVRLCRAFLRAINSSRLHGLLPKAIERFRPPGWDSSLRVLSLHHALYVARSREMTPAFVEAEEGTRVSLFRHNLKTSTCTKRAIKIAQDARIFRLAQLPLDRSQNELLARLASSHI